MTTVEVRVPAEDMGAEAASVPTLPSLGPQAGLDHPRGESGVAMRWGAWVWPQLYL